MEIESGAAAVLVQGKAEEMEGRLLLAQRSRLLLWMICSVNAEMMQAVMPIERAGPWLGRCSVPAARTELAELVAQVVLVERMR